MAVQWVSKDEGITRAGLEVELVRRSFPDYLERVRIMEPPVLNTPDVKGPIPFEPWPHLLALAQLLASSRLVAVLKARQVGVTWLVAAYLTWRANYHPGEDWLLLSRTELDAADFLGRVKTVQQLLPQHLVSPIVKDSTLLLTLANKSRLAAMASTEDAGRGHTYSGVAQDEADFHPYLSENYGAVKPTIDGGGQMLMVSTVNKRKMGSLFKNVLSGAPGNGWGKLFIPYAARPGRDEAWYASTRAAVPPSLGMTPELYMEQEYPRSELEALAPSRALAFFDTDALLELERDVMPPREQHLGGAVKVWRPPMVAGKYVAGGDLAWGERGAYSCLTVIDWATGEQVAEIHGRLKEDEMALETVKLCRRYNEAFVGIEMNGEGKNVVNKMVELGYGQRMYNRDGEGSSHETAARPKRGGWLTNGATRPVMLGELEEAVRQRAVRPRCGDGVREMMGFVRDERGVPTHTAGMYSDHVMSWAVAWQMRKYAKYGLGSRQAYSMEGVEVRRAAADRRKGQGYSMEGRG